MPLTAPNLDDRDFNQLVEAARLRIQRTCPTWTDLSPGDPGIVLLELFAFLTETMIYRLNRLPEKAYIEFLRLMGVRLQPPAAAGAVLRFTRSRPGSEVFEIPRGTRVTLDRPASGSEAQLFITSRTVSLPAGASQVEVLAHHCELVEGELAGIGTSLPGLTIQARHPPIVAPSGDELDLLVGVEVDPGEAIEAAALLQFGEKRFRLWQEAESFANLGSERHVYVADRMAGQVIFAPAARISQPSGDLTDLPQALAEVPPAGREIRLWYRHGGGPQGNLPPETLTVMKDPIPGLAVTNPAAATGGRAAESLANALVRGPQELHSLQRAVTARDFELVALLSSRAVTRAKALTRLDLWAHAAPGTVEVLLVPYLPEAGKPAGHVTAAALQARQSETARSQIQATLDERRPIGTACAVNWARYKEVRVTARLVIRREEDPAQVRQRVLERLYASLNALPSDLNPGGWSFGQALRASHVYEVALGEPGVLWVDQVRLLVAEVPAQDIASVERDPHQASTWYAASRERLFRSLDDGDGWEIILHAPGETLEGVRAHPDRAGVLAAVTRLPQDAGGRIYLSSDLGESWQANPITTAFPVNDLAWVLREGQPVLFLATDAGLYELDTRPGSSPVQVLVDPQDQKRAFYAVTSSRDLRGQVSVAVAAQTTGGVFLSSEGGRPNTFRLIGLQGSDIRVLAVQVDGPRAFLWAGAYAAGQSDNGKGCFRWELRGREDPPEGWVELNQGWTGGSCRALAFLGNQALAASYRQGVLRLDLTERNPAWQAPDVRCGLPLRDPGRFHPVDSVAADPGGGLALAGGVEGVFRSTNGGLNYATASQGEFTDKVTLPPTWLFSSGEHDITVVSEDEVERD
jgi:hypothetical protein